MNDADKTTVLQPFRIHSRILENKPTGFKHYLLLRAQRMIAREVSFILPPLHETFSFLYPIPATHIA